MAVTKKERLNIENALEQIALAEKAAETLKYSFKRVPEIRMDKDFNEAEWERWDALAARFARLADILTQRVFRAIDIVEFLPPSSTYIDRINRAEKRGHIQSAYEWKEIRELRNQIVHEYTTEYLLSLLQDTVDLTPKLLKCVDQLSSYTGVLISKLDDDNDPY